MRRATSNTKTTLVLAALLAIAPGMHALAQTPPAPAPAAPPAVDKDAPLIIQALSVCFRCHGTGGVSTFPTRPTIGGQKPMYILQQLESFQLAAKAQGKDVDGDADDPGATGDPAKPEAAAPPTARYDPIMAHLLKNLNPGMLQRLSDEVARRPCDGGEAKAPPANPPAMPRIAQRCAVCHGVDGIGNMEHIPNLAGQQRAYLRRELLLLRETSWGAKPREHESWRSHPSLERQDARISLAMVDVVAAHHATPNRRGGGKT